MKVRFKTPTCEYGRIVYEVRDSSRGNWEYDDLTSKYEEVYDLIGLGLVPIRLLEETADENDIPAVDIFVRLANTKA